MFDSIKNYIMATLFTLVCTFGYVSYSLYGSNSVLQAQTTHLTQELKVATENVDKALLSCKAGQDITKDVNTSIKTQMERMTERLEVLAVLTDPTPPGDTNEGSNSTTGARGTYVDGGRLSPHLMRLLNESYCDSNKNDSACTTK